MPPLPNTCTEQETAAFASVVTILRYLRGPDGCPWDRRQTLESIRPNMLEEPAELVEAIHAFAAGANEKTHSHLREEFGDVFLVWMMMMIMYDEAQPHGTARTLEELAEKLVRRHPHVFERDERAQEAHSDAKLSKQWDAIKAKEGKSFAISDFGAYHPALDVLERTRKLHKQLDKIRAAHRERSGPTEKTAAQKNDPKNSVAASVIALEAAAQKFAAQFAEQFAEQFAAQAEQKAQAKNRAEAKAEPEHTDVDGEFLIAEMLSRVVELARARGISPSAALMRYNARMVDEHNSLNAAQ